MHAIISALTFKCILFQTYILVYVLSVYISSEYVLSAHIHPFNLTLSVYLVTFFEVYVSETLLYVFLAGQNSSIGDLVTHSLIEGTFTFDITD